MSDLNLKDALPALVKEGTKYPGKLETFLPDFALYGFVTDVREHATAVDILADSKVPRASFANARAALESAVDSALLVSDEKQYLYRGAQARIAELFEIHELEKRAAPLDPPLPADAPARMHREDVVIADAKAWDEQAPGKGDLLKRAWEAFTKVPGAVRMHWSLLPKEQIYGIVFGGEEAKLLGGMADVIHALLSMASHPRMRVGSRDVEFAEDGGILLGTRETDPDMARKIAALACIIATSSLQRRRTFTVELT
jgi:hypothetical protein